MTPAPYAGLVARHGLSAAHRRLLAAVPDGARVLDVGCAAGYLGAELRRRGCTVVGVEPDAEAAHAAAAAGLEVLVGGADEPGVLASALLLGPFDVVLLGDVLEHLADPGAVLAALREAAPRAVVSLPNVAHWTGRRALLRGRFPQEDHGLFDRTHLRWFTPASARALAREAGWDVEAAHPVPAPLPLQARVPALRALEARAAAWRPSLFALQVVLVLSAPGATRSAGAPPARA